MNPFGLMVRDINLMIAVSMIEPSKCLIDSAIDGFRVVWLGNWFVDRTIDFFISCFAQCIVDLVIQTFVDFTNEHFDDCLID